MEQFPFPISIWYASSYFGSFQIKNSSKLITVLNIESAMDRRLWLRSAKHPRVTFFYCSSLSNPVRGWRSRGMLLTRTKGSFSIITNEKILRTRPLFFEWGFCPMSGPPVIYFILFINESTCFIVFYGSIVIFKHPWGHEPSSLFYEILDESAHRETNVGAVSSTIFDPFINVSISENDTLFLEITGNTHKLCGLGILMVEIS